VHNVASVGVTAGRRGGGMDAECIDCGVVRQAIWSLEIGLLKIFDAHL